MDAGETPETILNILLGKLSGKLSVEILEKIPTNYQCNCSRERVKKALISVGKKDLQEMIDEGKPVELHCHF